MQTLKTLFYLIIDELYNRELKMYEYNTIWEWMLEANELAGWIANTGFSTGSSNGSNESYDQSIATSLEVS